MTSERRTLLTLAAAIFLPLLLFLALQSAASLRAHRREMETEALTRALQTNAVIDGQLMADLSALDVLASSQMIETHDWRGYQARLQTVQQRRPRWKAVVLTEFRTGRQVLKTNTAIDGSGAVRAAGAPELSGVPTWAGIGGITPGPPPCPCVAIQAPVFVDGARVYTLTAEVGTEDFQRALNAHATPEHLLTSAVVDRNGVFIARTHDPQNRVGKPGSVYLRNAVRRSGGGIYRGVTLEGQDNFTAYQTSPVSGWSTHIALQADQFLAPVRGSLAYTLLAALVAAGFAVVIAAFAFFHFREREREAARQLQSQKLEAMGQLASGVAHDFGNLLAVVVGALRRVPESTDNADIRAAAEQALGAASRGMSLTRQLLNFARTKPITVERVDLEALLDNIRPLLAQALGPRISLTVSVAPAARYVRGSAALLDLALLNMAVNARDAMPEGGELEVRAAPELTQPDWIKIEVRDTGHGMSKAILDRVMEPFFTTKPEGKGTGLGAMQILAAVRPAGGAVEVQSEEGVGTTFTLRLPVWAEA